MRLSFKNYHTELLFEEYLFESQNYEDMFRPFMSDEVYRPVIAKYIKDAKVALKKSDRIVWFLKHLRLFLTLLKFGEDAFEKELKKPNNVEIGNITKKNWLTAYEKFQEKDRTTQDIFDYLSDVYFEGNLEDLRHLYSLGIKDIDEYKLYNQELTITVMSLQNLESEYNAQFQKMVPDTNEKDWTKLISFPDGFAWYNLNVSYCPEEGKAMGHCGNQAAGPDRPYERVLSLRKTVKHAGKTYYDPHLTFILNTKNHSLGEMKGKGNSKPSEKYHKYIVPLLKKTDLIQRIHGGGYKPENNFSFNDLNDKDKEEVLKVNPDLSKNSFIEMLNAGGYNAMANPSTELLVAGYRQLQDLVEEGFDVILPKEEPTTENVKELIGDIDLQMSFNGFGDLLSSLGTRDAERTWEWVESGDFSSGETIENDTFTEYVQYIFEEEPELAKKIKFLLKIKYEDDDIDILDSEEDYSFEDLAELIWKELPEVSSLLERSLYYVSEDMMRSDAMDQIRDSLYSLSEYFSLSADSGHNIAFEDYVYGDESTRLEFNGSRGFVKFMDKLVREGDNASSVSEVIPPIDFDIRINTPYFDNEIFRSAVDFVKDEFDPAYKSDKKTIEDSLPAKQLKLFPEGKKPKK